MKYPIFLFLFCFLVNYCWGEASADDETKITLCVNGTRIDLVVNLLDKECIEKAENNTSLADENSVEVKDIDMNEYSVCLLQKASIIDDQGRFNQHFNIIKIVENLYKKTDDKGTGLILIVQAIDKCRKLNENATAMKIMKCLIDNQISLVTMSRYGPKIEPWQSTRGYEKVKPYHVPSIPIIHDRWIPSYVPDEILTAHLTFPNLVTGYNQIPFHAAGKHYTTDQWNEHRERIQKNVKLCLANVKPIKENLENLVREKKRKLENRKENIRDVSDVNLKINELSSILEKTIKACDKMQDCKRQLEAFARSIEAPLQISQECLYHRERKDKSELVDDEVEKLLMEETKIFCQSIQQLKECLQCCENKLVEGRRYQCDLENCIKKAQWAVVVDKSKEAIDKLLESNAWIKQADCLKSKSCSINAYMEYNRNEANKTIKEIKQCISKIWNETNDAFAKRHEEIERAKNEIESSNKTIKNEIINVEKNAKYLQSSKDKEIYEELQRAKDKLEFLSGTKKMLDSELSAKMKSLFIDTHGCMTMRKSFPISIITDFN